MKKNIFFFLFSFFIAVHQLVAGTGVLVTVQQVVSKVEYITIVNKSKKELSFHYNDELFESTLISVLPQKSVRINTIRSVFLKQSNDFHSFYILYPGDSVIASVNENGNAVFTVPGNIIRSNELNMVRQMNEKATIGYNQMLEYRKKLFNTNFKKLDSIYRFD